MADVFSPTKRSQIMSRIRSHGNLSTEMRLLVAFRAVGIIGWRRHVRILGRPDFAFRRARVAVFVDGDYWHGNPKTFKLPLSNTAFWEAKIKYNRARDSRVTRQLRACGWTVVRIWESSLRRHTGSCVARVVRALARHHQ